MASCFAGTQTPTNKKTGKGDIGPRLNTESELGSKTPIKKNKHTDLTTLFGGKELDKNHVNRISLEQMHPSLIIIGTIVKSIIICVG